MVDKDQFQELAMGFEQSNRPFLWVVRPDSDKDLPDGFMEDGNDIVKFDVIKEKIDRLFEEAAFKERALCLEEMICSSARGRGGEDDSYKNLSNQLQLDRRG
ncbi:hypothetical protein BUALT_Bualt16G0018800 [Buddleja alternifolia]|uniref:Uncharacterized protein n=1 Tax=Buddleja alternifolia TaxID=168488 RepID=A0AAV6W607_9LAMI|nr:hypothetical protein BUALT_Bualt16G0018800 [Buddleja alternifolia]